MQLEVSPLYAITIVEVVLYSLVMVWMGMRVSKARILYRVPLPAAYEIKQGSDFNRYQRAHQNSVENAPTFFASLMISGLGTPILSAIAGALYILGRVVYCLSYYVDVKSRSNGQFYFIAQWYLLGGCLFVAYKVAVP